MPCGYYHKDTVLVRLISGQLVFSNFLVSGPRLLNFNICEFSEFIQFSEVYDFFKGHEGSYEIFHLK